MSSSKKTTCCTFSDKVLLFKDVSPSVQSTWNSTKPPQLADANFNTINIKLALIDNSINFLQLGSQAIEQEAPIAIESIVDQIKGDSSPGNIIKGMSDSEKCYLCKRVAEYADGTSMLGAIERQIGITGTDKELFLEDIIEKLDDQQVPQIDQKNNPDPYNYLKVLESLNCKQFGFASIYGGNFGATQNAPITERSSS